MNENKKAYFQPRIMRHVTQNTVEYAMHDVYFTKDDVVDGCTVDALSPRTRTVALLAAMLEKMLRSDASAFVCGDLGYTYTRDDIEFWLEYIDKPVIDYEEPGRDKPDAITFNRLDNERYPVRIAETTQPVDLDKLFPLQRWVIEVGDKPLEELTLRDLCIAVRQDEYPEYVVPLALEVLALDPLAGHKYQGELAYSLRGVRPRDWESMPAEKERLLTILRDAYTRFGEEELKPELLRR